MRFKQYLKEAPQFETDINKIWEILDDWGLADDSRVVGTPGNYLVDVSMGVNISAKMLVNGALPIKFRTVEGQFNAAVCGLKTLEGFPTRVQSYVDVRDNFELTSLEFAPKFIHGEFYIANTKITSLVGINDYIENMDTFSFNAAAIKEGGLGLLLIKGVSISLRGSSNKEPFLIIQKYLGRPDDIYDCQTELIDNGFEEYAKL